MDITISYIGTFIGLTVAIISIIYNISPIYSLLLGALIGGIVGGATLSETIAILLKGSSDMVPAVMRILSAGVLVGVLFNTGATQRIGLSIMNTFGGSSMHKVFFALAISGMLLSAIGVFIEIAIITLAPIALNIAHRANLSRCSVLVALSGGGKAGNIISPNPNTIAGAEAFDIELLDLMMANIIPAIIALGGTILIANYINNKLKDKVIDNDEIIFDKELPSIGVAIVGPIVAILILLLKPLMNISIDPLIALPIGGLCGCIAMRKIKLFNSCMKIGLQKTGHICLLLLGTGALSGIIQHSDLDQVLIGFLHSTGVSVVTLAPLSGMIMGLATGSVTAGTAIASNSFGGTLVDLGISPLAAAATIHSGATVFDHAPHGAFFHATSEALGMNFNNRLKAMPFETLVGLIITGSSWILYFLFQ